MVAKFYSGGWVPSYDESFSPADPVKMFALGHRMVFGYAGTQSSKNMTVARIASRRAAGLGIGALFESTEGRALTAGATGGSRDAVATRNAWHVLGYPAACPIIFALDKNVSLSQIKGPVANYMHGAAGAFPQGVLPWLYGENDAIEWLFAQGLIGGGFQSAAWAWGDPAKPITTAAHAAHAAVLQERNSVNVAGGNVDLGHTRSDAPFWWPTSTPPSRPTPPGPAPIRPGSRVLRYVPGQPQMRGDDVAALQRFLKPDDAPASWVDGQYGPATAERVSWYEGMRGIHQEKPYGVAGPQVWAATGLH